MTPEQEIKLRNQLDKLHQWPDVYLFKFIVPNEAEKIKELKSYFTDQADIQERESKKGTYVAVSIKEVMQSTDEVVSRYRSIKSIEGLMSL